MRPRGATATSLRNSAPVFAALGDVNRLRLVTRLCAEGPLSIARLSRGAPISRQAVTKHLHALAEAGLARGSRRGREQVWELEPKRLEKAREYLNEISTQWDRAIDRLRAMVEDDSL
ncbi:MAG TPA: metalloregulator ArsR/SmtB family transcription factor [Candidatus Binataceae bacterium]|nr:metalloregulator ArsR/SmtB family transcription factor [Candidatus Binataceae bacterium]